MPTEIEIHCPSCRKASTTPAPPPGDFACPRCRCDLSILAAIKSDAARLLHTAREPLLRGEHAAALIAAATSWDLRHTGTAASLAFVAATLTGDPVEGAAWLRSSRHPDFH